MIRKNNIYIQWSNAPANILAITSTRYGGLSKDNSSSFNLSTKVHDLSANVHKNIKILIKKLNLPMEPILLNQQHTNKIIKFDTENKSQFITADASWTECKNIPIAILTADCMPIFITNKDTEFVAAIHAGWQGLAKRIIANSVKDISSKYNPKTFKVWIGPSIKKNAFKVNDDVLNKFLKNEPKLQDAIKSEFIKNPHYRKHSLKDKVNSNGKYLVNLAAIAKIQLNSLGIEHIEVSNICSYSNNNFFSFRRDGFTGRMVSIIMLL